MHQSLSLTAVQNPRKSGEDDAAYNACLGQVFKEKYGEEFHFLPCYFFLHNNPKFLTLILADDDTNVDEQGSKKQSGVGGKDEHPITSAQNN